MIKNNKFLYYTSSIFLVTNILLWLIIATLYARWTHYDLISKLLLFLQPAVYIASVVGLWKKNKYIYFSTIFFLLLNVVLSFTLSVGFMDFIFTISALSLTSLLLQYKDFIKK